MTCLKSLLLFSVVNVSGGRECLILGILQCSYFCVLKMLILFCLFSMKEEQIYLVKFIHLSSELYCCMSYNMLLEKLILNSEKDQANLHKFKSMYLVFCFQVITQLFIVTDKRETRRLATRATPIFICNKV